MRQSQRADDQRDRVLRVVTEGTEPGRDLPDPLPMQETYRGIPQQGHHGWSLPDVDQTGVFPKVTSFRCSRSASVSCRSRMILIR